MTRKSIPSTAALCHFVMQASLEWWIAVSSPLRNACWLLCGSMSVHLLEHQWSNCALISSTDSAKQPQVKKLLQWERKTFATGSFFDIPRSGRPATRLEHVTAIQDSVAQCPAKSLLKRVQNCTFRFPH